MHFHISICHSYRFLFSDTLIFEPFSRDISRPQSIYAGPGFHLCHWLMGTGAILVCLKRPWSEDDQSPSSSAEVKNAWRYTSSRPYIFFRWCLFKQFCLCLFPKNLFYIFSSNNRWLTLGCITKFFTCRSHKILRGNITAWLIKWDAKCSGPSPFKVQHHLLGRTEYNNENLFESSVSRFESRNRNTVNMKNYISAEPHTIWHAPLFVIVQIFKPYIISNTTLKCT